MSNKSVVITSAVRTAVGSLNKSLKNVPGYELGSAVIKGSLDQSKIKKEDLMNSEKTGLFALWCASNNANEFSGKMISENDQIVSAKYKAWISAQNLKL